MKNIIKLILLFIACNFCFAKEDTFSLMERAEKSGITIY